MAIAADPRASAAEYADGRTCLIGEREMSKRRETASERVWKEKLDLCLSTSEVTVLFVFAATVVVVMWIMGR